MSKHDFNESAHILNEYNLKLRPHCGMTPIRDGDDDPLFQAEVFRGKVGDWMESEGFYQRRMALTTETLAPSPDGYPRMRIVCTPEAMKAVGEEFGRAILATDLVREDVGSRRVIKKPDTHKNGRNLKP